MALYNLALMIATAKKRSFSFHKYTIVQLILRTMYEIDNKKAYIEVHIMCGLTYLYV